MGSRVGILATALAAVAVSLPAATASIGAASSTGFRPLADGYVSAGSPRTSFGKARTLRLAPRPASRAYLRFRVRLAQGAVDRAVLRVYATGGRGRLQARAVARRSWTERSLVYARAPRVGRVLASTRFSRGWKSLDLSALARGGGTFDVALTATGTGGVASRESGRRAPRLLITAAPVVAAAGDIADCASNGDEETAALLAKLPETVVAANGDLAYENGTAAEFANCYAPSWGRFKGITRPAAGNHEYGSPAAAPYFAYWGAVAGTPGQGWYSYDLGSWHVVVLNSNCAFVGGCQAGTPQETWLRADLAAHRATCTLAYWHHPVFSSGYTPPAPEVRPLFQALYDARVELVLTAHAHNYQRWAPLSPTGALDQGRGVREFVVGTGGKTLRPVGPRVSNQEVSNDQTFGVLQLTLRTGSYAWKFVPVAGQTFSDSGSGTCR
jgi:acid phosphatase type 7